MDDFKMRYWLTVFDDEPPLPPSKIRAIQKSKNCEETESFLAPIKRLMTNKCYLMLWNSYGVAIGVLNAISTLVNQMVLIHFEVHTQTVI